MSTQLKLNVEEGNIYLSAPYSNENNEVWRSLGGKFVGGCWVIPDNNASRMNIVDLFGAKSEVVDALVPASATYESRSACVQIGGYVLATRRHRDHSVRMPDGVSLHAGKFALKGGSVKNPSVALGSDVVFRLRCRKNFAERFGLEIVNETEPKIEI